MKQTITQSDFIRAFDDCGRSGQFSRDARALLFDYLKEMEADTGEETELDVIAICCDYSEMTAAEVRENYGLETPEDEDEAEEAEDVRDYLNENTSLVGETSDGFVFAQF